MAVRLRLRRMGRKKRPYYRIVAADSRAPRDGRFIEMVGTYNPLVKPHQIDLKEDRVFYWLENGAQPSTTVKSLFRTKGLWLKWDLKCAGADDSKIAEEFAKWEILQEEKAKRMEEQERKVKAGKKAVEEEEPETGTGVKTEEPVAEKKAEEKTEAAEEMKETVKDEEPAPEAAAGESAEQAAEPEEKTVEEYPDDREDKKE